MLSAYRNLSYAIYLRTANVLLRFPGHRFRLLVLRRFCRITIGPRTSIERGVQVTTKGHVVIGSGCNINSGTLLDGRGNLVIGNLVNISPRVTILTASHDPQSATFEGVYKAVHIRDRAWIASAAMILPGVSVGTGAVVGAGSVVARSVPDWTIVAGSPATPRRTRDEKAQSSLPPSRQWLH